MKQASVAAVHGQVFSEVRGKYAAWVYDSDMNTVYLTGFVYTQTFHSDLSVNLAAGLLKA